MTTENNEIDEDVKVTSAEDTEDHDLIEAEDDGEDEKTAKVDSELEEAETDEAREEIRARRRNERKSRGRVDLGRKRRFGDDRGRGHRWRTVADAGDTNADL